MNDRDTYMVFFIARNCTDFWTFPLYHTECLINSVPHCNLILQCLKPKISKSKVSFKNLVSRSFDIEQNLKNDWFFNANKKILGVWDFF